MKIRGSDKAGEKIEPQMAPMIDVVFQLLIFFMLTLKIIEPEGAVNVNMPIGAPSDASDDALIDAVKVRLLANSKGQLIGVKMGLTDLGNDDKAFDDLNARIADRVTNGSADEMEAEIDADPELHWTYTMKAISAVRGKMDTSQDPPQIIPLIEKIKFAPPREEGGAGEPAG